MPKILIVDDEKDVVALLCNYFDLCGYDVISACDGKKALEKISQNPDIILLDVNMPKLNGLEVCKKIREFVSCPILFLTANVDDIDNVGVVMITANSCTTSAVAILKMISQKIGKSMNSRKDLLMTELINYFRDTNRLIIVDEADHLTMAAVQALRNLNDEAHVGIVLSGNDKIYNQMVSGAKSSELQQLRSRILVRRRVTNEYTLEEFKNIFPDLNNECLGYLIQLARKESLRTAIKLLRIAYDVNPSVSIKTLKEVQKELTEGLC